MKYLNINDTIINLAQIQSVNRGVDTVEVIFINKERVSITTNTFDYLLEGRYTNAKRQEYENLINKWQEKVINLIFKELQENDK